MNKEELASHSSSIIPHSSFAPRLPTLFYSFRARLLLVLAALLVATLGVQYYLNRLEQRKQAVLIAEQEQALAASTTFALDSISSPTKEYLWQLDATRPVSFLEEQSGRVMNILVVRDSDGRVDDSLDPQYAPKTLDDGTAKYLNIRDVPLPTLVEAGQTTSDIRKLLPSSASTVQPLAGEPRVFPIPVRTTEGVNYIIIVLGAAKTSRGDTRFEDVRPYLPTLSVLLAATLAAGVLVWRFTRPFKDLSQAARRVAAGDLDFDVPADRRDETGTLASNFNEMIARLRRTRELESRLNQVERSAVVGRLASAIAHEIRNPLNYINLTLDHLRTTFAPDDAQKRETVNRLTDQLKTEVARINKRVSEFLKYTRPADLDMRPLDLRAVVEDALRLVEVQARESLIETRVEQDGELPPVAGDAESLRSAFTNLIINGLHAIEGQNDEQEQTGERRLTIRLASADGRARIEIADTGVGIAPESVSQIFEPYFSTKDTGTGLGLAIVKKAVEDHGGDITVSSAPGAGTTFKIELPIGGNDE